ncbi:hypothetical protein AVEN_210959-1 [Araneus ventricosus]|uniref:Uncharacterized protein n=1 Tax=Araneus ventricosus TaxID=182803 RepID=A0A4Y2DH43_ARAVE|nr:hypothetical protein AVEN_210959-1 [Araneus ventricosus]
MDTKFQWARVILHLLREHNLTIHSKFPVNRTRVNRNPGYPKCLRNRKTKKHIVCVLHGNNREMANTRHYIDSPATDSPIQKGLEEIVKEIPGCEDVEACEVDEWIVADQEIVETVLQAKSRLDRRAQSRRWL